MRKILIILLFVVSATNCIAQQFKQIDISNYAPSFDQCLLNIDTGKRVLMFRVTKNGNTCSFNVTEPDYSFFMTSLYKDNVSEDEKANVIDNLVGAYVINWYSNQREEVDPLANLNVQARPATQEEQVEMRNAQSENQQTENQNKALRQTNQLVNNEQQSQRSNDNSGDSEDGNSGIEGLFGILVLLFLGSKLLKGFFGGGSKTSWDNYSNEQKSEIHEHDNAQ